MSNPILLLWPWSSAGTTVVGRYISTYLIRQDYYPPTTEKQNANAVRSENELMKLGPFQLRSWYREKSHMADSGKKASAVVFWYFFGVQPKVQATISLAVYITSPHGCSLADGGGSFQRPPNWKLQQQSIRNTGPRKAYVLGGMNTKGVRARAPSKNGGRE